MNGTSERLKMPKKTPSTATKPAALSGDALAEIAERLALIQGHYAKLRGLGVVSGVRMLDGFLLVAFQIPEHDLDIVSGAWLIDGKNVTQLTESETK